MDLLPALEDLDDHERLLVEAKLRGCSVAQCAAAAGMLYATARVAFQRVAVKEALKKGREISAAATAMTRERLSDMLMGAYRTAGCVAEMVTAVNALAKLHALNAPAKLEIDHSHRLAAVRTQEQLRALSVDDLERLANLKGQDFSESEFAELPRLTRTVADAEVA